MVWRTISPEKRTGLHFRKDPKIVMNTLWYYWVTMKPTPGPHPRRHTDLALLIAFSQMTKRAFSRDCERDRAGWGNFWNCVVRWTATRRPTTVSG